MTFAPVKRKSRYASRSRFLEEAGIGGKPRKTAENGPKPALRPAPAAGSGRAPAAGPLVKDFGNVDKENTLRIKDLSD
jgi:hypothetical protein